MNTVVQAGAAGGRWLTALRNDKRLIFTAAAHAQRAADFLHAFQRGAVEAAA